MKDRYVVYGIQDGNFYVFCNDSGKYAIHSHAFNFEAEAQEKCDELNKKESNMIKKRFEVIASKMPGTFFVYDNLTQETISSYSIEYIMAHNMCANFNADYDNTLAVMKKICMYEGESPHYSGENDKEFKRVVRELSCFKGEQEFKSYYKEYYMKEEHTDEWVNGDECSVRGLPDKYLFVGKAAYVKDCAVVQGPMSNPFVIRCIDLSRPETAAQKQQRERETAKEKQLNDVAKELNRVICEITNSYSTSIESFLTEARALQDAGLLAEISLPLEK